jgi:hypothetical protein
MNAFVYSAITLIAPVMNTSRVLRAWHFVVRAGNAPGPG